MAKRKTTKLTKTTKSKAATCDSRSVLCRPSTWIVSILALALLVVYGLSMYGFKHLESKNKLDSAKLATFDHIAKQYIKDMEFDVDGQPVIKQATGYGVSDEDGTFYITFDFAPYPTEGTNYSSLEELSPHHAIIYFQWDDQAGLAHGTYGHAFGYYDDASYHPDGEYVKLEEY